MSKYTSGKTTVSGNEAWYVYENGQPHPIPHSNEKEALDYIEHLKRKELEAQRNQSLRKPGDD